MYFLPDVARNLVGNITYAKEVFLPGDFPRTSSQMINHSASRSMQNFGGPFHVRNVLMTHIISLICAKGSFVVGELIFVITRLRKKLRGHLVIFVLDHVQKVRILLICLRQKLLTMKAFS